VALEPCPAFILHPLRNDVLVGEQGCWLTLSGLTGDDIIQAKDGLSPPVVTLSAIIA
jgi:hypothetical protein